MTRIQIEKTEGKIGITCSGHAGYSNPGTDIVCAGISAMMCAWQAKCMELYERNRITIEKWDVEFGNIEIVIHTESMEVLEAFSVVEIGLKLIWQQYPEYIKWCGEK